MPAPALAANPCSVCKKAKAPAAFRDPGDVRRGRPPKTCATCRAKSPALQAEHARNVAYRPENRRKHREDYAARTPAQTLADRARIHPDGLKRCPSPSGCGFLLPLEDFAEDTHQAAGLASLCRSCSTTAHHLTEETPA